MLTPAPKLNATVNQGNADAAIISIAVAMPVYRDAGTLREAAACILEQTLAQSEKVSVTLWLVLNGSDAATRATAIDIAMRAGTRRARGNEGESQRDGSRVVPSVVPRVVVRELTEASLAKAANVVIQESGAMYIARMDADDWCPANRLELQLALLEANPHAGACFCAWESVDARDARVCAYDAVHDSSLAPWRLLWENPYAHGSALLRASALKAVDGYDESFARAQDYDLWLRLAQECEIVSHPAMLYRHRLRHSAGAGAIGGWSGNGGASTPSLDGQRLQAFYAARARAKAFAKLPTLDSLGASSAQHDALCAIAAEYAIGASESHAYSNGKPDLKSEPGPNGEPDQKDDGLLRAIMHATHGVTAKPTREAIDTLLRVRAAERVRAEVAENVCFASRVREVAGTIARELSNDLARGGATSLWLFGAGRHTRRLLSMWQHDSERRIKDGWPTIVGVVDDYASLDTKLPNGVRVTRPESLSDSDAVLISSDVHEEAIYQRCQPLRDKGVRVYRFYA